MAGKPLSAMTIKLLARYLAGNVVTAGEWVRQAQSAGADPELFFPPHDDPGAEARKYCRQCPVKVSCLAYAMGNREAYGIWGGLYPAERQDLRRQLQSRDTGTTKPARRRPDRGAA